MNPAPHGGDLCNCNCGKSLLSAGPIEPGQTTGRASCLWCGHGGDHIGLAASLPSEPGLRRPSWRQDPLFELYLGDRVDDPEEGRRLPIGPFRPWLRRAVAEVGREDVCALLNITRRRLYALLEETATVDLDIVDRAGCRSGNPWLLRELYPELYLEVAA